MPPSQLIRRWLCRRGHHGYEAFPDQLNVGACPYCGIVRVGKKKRPMRYEVKR